MDRGVGSIWCLVLLIPGLLPGCYSEVTAVIDSYTHKKTLTSGDLALLGTQIILVCRVVGLSYGTPLSYTWTCPNGPCEVEGYYGRKIYNEHILAVNTTSTSNGGTYTCQVTAGGGQEATGTFTLRVTGGDVVHSYGRLIPHEFPITDLQQISGPDGIGRINCTVSSTSVMFFTNGGHLQTGGVSQTGNRYTRSTLTVKPPNIGSFQNRALYCTKANTNFFYLYISSANPLSVPSLMVGRVTNSELEYQVQRNDNITSPLITGYEVTRFGVPMIGEYMNTGRGRRVTISRAVLGAKYRITAWALHGNYGGRSATPAVVYATTGEARPSYPQMLSITRILKAGIELNWLPPTEPNGEVHYVIYYTPEGGTKQSIDTGSDLTHYNLTGLERNRAYTNISVWAVNSVGWSYRSAVIARYSHPLPVPTPPRGVTITRVLLYDIELNWLPPTEPNGEVHYVIYYTPEGGTEQSIDTGSNLTHYNLTGLERNRVYADIAVEAVNVAGRSYRSALIARYNHTPPVPTPPRDVTITRVFQGGLELNWLPPTEPNGEVHYVICYSSVCGSEQSIDTRSDLTHYSLTGLEGNRVYAIIAVQAVNSVGRSDRSVVIAQYNHTEPDTEVEGPITSSAAPSRNPFLPAVIVLVVVVLLLLTCVALLVLALAVIATKLNKLKVKKGHADPPHCYNQTGVEEGETTERICDEVEERTGPSEGQSSGPYQELEFGTMEERHYETLNKDTRA